MAKLSSKVWLLLSVCLIALVVYAAPLPPHIDELNINGNLTVDGTTSVADAVTINKSGATPGLLVLSEGNFGTTRVETRFTSDTQYFQFYKGGTSNANMTNGQSIVNIQFNPRHGGGNNSAAEIRGVYKGDGTTRSAEIQFHTGNSGSPAERVAVSHLGTLDITGIGTTARDALSSPDTGAMIYNSDNDRHEYYNGSAWRAVGPTITDWAACSSALTIDGATTAPTKASSTVIDACRFRRVGDTMELFYEYRHTSNSGAAAGNGNYLFQIPEGKDADTAKIAVTNNGSYALVGSASIFHATVEAHGSAMIAEGDADSIVLRVGNETTAPATVGSGHFAITGSQVIYTFNVRIPIDGWSVGSDPD